MPLLVRLAVGGRAQVDSSPAVIYDEVAGMSRLADGTWVIDARGFAPGTKKRDIEKGEDQKDRW